MNQLESALAAEKVGLRVPVEECEWRLSRALLSHHAGGFSGFRNHLQHHIDHERTTPLSEFIERKLGETDEALIARAIADGLTIPPGRYQVTKPIDVITSGAQQ